VPRALRPEGRRALVRVRGPTHTGSLLASILSGGNAWARRPRCGVPQPSRRAHAFPQFLPPRRRSEHPCAGYRTAEPSDSPPRASSYATPRRRRAEALPQAARASGAHSIPCRRPPAAKGGSPRASKPKEAPASPALRPNSPSPEIRCAITPSLRTLSPWYRPQRAVKGRPPIVACCSEPIASYFACTTSASQNPKSTLKEKARPASI
jgi:hypothetical protein